MVVDMYIISPKKDQFKPVFFGLFDFPKWKDQDQDCKRPFVGLLQSWSCLVLVQFGCSLLPVLGLDFQTLFSHHPLLTSPPSHITPFSLPILFHNPFLPLHPLLSSSSFSSPFLITPSSLSTILHHSLLALHPISFPSSFFPPFFNQKIV